ncbi:hypothetical protein cyc_00570 [Cyclospora cayetanensis]|uniref:Uncharacterized protein n=1 Tax=Cyclospora cayetanensis TaxID=88456 RepID=A0A1D3CYP2_9EIME|nr:hypothetical protein cyc_00570 [Cyclospora cayetanensis]
MTHPYHPDRRRRGSAWWWERGLCDGATICTPCPVFPGFRRKNIKAFALNAVGSSRGRRQTPLRRQARLPSHMPCGRARHSTWGFERQPKRSAYAEDLDGVSAFSHAADSPRVAASSPFLFSSTIERHPKERAK